MIPTLGQSIGQSIIAHTAIVEFPRVIFSSSIIIHQNITPFIMGLLTSTKRTSWILENSTQTTGKRIQQLMNYQQVEQATDIGPL